MTTIQIDVASDCPADTLALVLENHSGTIESFTLFGPGGGGPSYTLSFPNSQTASEFISDFYDEDDVDLDLYLIK